MDIKRLLQIGKPLAIKADEFVCREGDHGNCMYLILKGRVGVYTYNVDGSRIQLAELMAGDFFGEMSLVDGAPRSADVQALEELTVFVINQSNFERVISTCPDLAVKIMKGMSLRIRELNHSLKEARSVAKELEVGIQECIQGDTEEIAVTANECSIKNQSVEEVCEQDRIIQDKLKNLLQSPEYIQIKNTIDKRIESSKSLKNKDDYLESIESDSQPIETVERLIDSIAPISYDAIVAPEKYNQYVFQGKVDCPVCEKSFEATRIRTTQIKQKSEEADFRIHYRDFEPYWYKIWVCPHCYYANFDHEFHKPHYLKKKVILGKTKSFKEKYPMEFAKKRSLKDVIAMHYLCQEIHEIAPKDRLAFAKVWLYLSWIFEDHKDTEMFDFAVNQTVESYVDMYNNDSRGLANGQEIRLCMLIAELYKKQKKYKEALFYLSKAVQMRTEPRMMREQASDRLMELKGIMKKVQAKDDKKNEANDDNK